VSKRERPKTEKQQQQRVLRRLDESLHQLTNGYYTLTDRHEHGAPAVGSVAAQDLSNQQRRTDGAPWGQEPAFTLQSLALMRLAAAADNLAATGLLIAAKREGLYSPWSVGRAVMEASGVAFWLLDPSLSIKDRVGRSLTDRLVSIASARRFGSKVGSGFNFEDRFQQVVEKTGVLDLHVMGEGWGRYVETPRPNKTQLVHDVLGPVVSPGIYSLFSGWAHGEAWAISEAVRYSPTVEDTAVPGRILRRPAITLDHYRFIAALCARSFTNAVDRAVDYFAWSAGDWTTVKSNSLKAIGKSDLLANR